MNLTEIRSRQEAIVAAARSRLNEITDATTASRRAEIEAAHDRAMADWDALELRAQREEKLTRREAAHGISSSYSAAPATGEQRRHEQAFDGFVRRGAEGLSAEQRSLLRSPREDRAQSVGVSTAGGFLVPDTFFAELVRSLKNWGPMLDPGVTRVIQTTTGATMTWPTMNDTANVGHIIGENQQFSQTEVTFGTKSLDAYKYTSGIVLISEEMLQDSLIDVEAILRDAVSERISRIANLHMTSGDGANKPRGIMNVIGTQAAAGGSAITFDDLINLEHSVDAAYRSDPSAKWMFSDDTLKALRKLKDLEGNYIWQPADAKTGAPGKILNRDYVINPDVPNVGSGNRSVVFGALGKYAVRTVKDLAVKRLVERYADYGQVGFIGFMRIDGEMLDTAAAKSLLHP